jgi:hypothetical protein
MIVMQYCIFNYYDQGRDRALFSQWCILTSRYRRVFNEVPVLGPVAQVTVSDLCENEIECRLISVSMEYASCDQQLLGISRRHQ